jgi:hypothetical protein
MPALPPSDLVVRTADGATIQLPSVAILRTWLASGRLGPHDRVRGSDGRWLPVRLAAEDLERRGPLPHPRIASQRLATRPMREPDLTVAPAVTLGRAPSR